jgi:hypothetical protein
MEVRAMYDQDKRKKNRAPKPGQWRPTDILLGLGGFIVLVALTVGAFRVAKYVLQTYF